MTNDLAVRVSTVLVIRVNPPGTHLSLLRRQILPSFAQHRRAPLLLDGCAAGRGRLRRELLDTVLQSGSLVPFLSRDGHGLVTGEESRQGGASVTKHGYLSMAISIFEVWN